MKNLMIFISLVLRCSLAHICRKRSHTQRAHSHHSGGCSVLLFNANDENGYNETQTKCPRDFTTQHSQNFPRFGETAKAPFLHDQLQELFTDLVQGMPLPNFISPIHVVSKFIEIKFVQLSFVVVVFHDGGYNA